jgi:hypothetical protein
MSSDVYAGFETPSEELDQIRAAVLRAATVGTGALNDIELTIGRAQRYEAYLRTGE